MKNQTVIAARFEPVTSAKPAARGTPHKGLPRSFDVLAASLGLILSAPLLLVSAMTVALTSRGGVLFRQERVGKDGDTFTLYKFRTMRVSNGGPQVTTAGDARITRPGRFLRSTKIDELPTLWNVLRGDMAFVGPRPEVPRYVKLEDPIWRAILATRPGITDPVTLELRDEERLLAQAKGDAEMYYLEALQPLKLKGYLAYLEKRNWRSDLNVLLRTVVAVVFPHRTSGSM